jgi:hypothetical protein
MRETRRRPWFLTADHALPFAKLQKLEETIMPLAIPLEQMSVAEKLAALEEIWDDLARTPENVPSPAWHADVLAARERRIAGGASRFLDVAEAKQAVRARLK